MQSPTKKLDQLLLDLSWSLWTELGVAGNVKKKHQQFLITLEELILLTVSLSDVDPRLRDESLDWCSQYHHFISISRLKSIMKGFGNTLNESFSIYSATLNSISKAAWPLFINSSPLKFKPSHKSCLRPLESPALLNLRARSIFGPGARADLLTFFLTHTQTNFAISEVIEIGYSKRNLAEILEEFSLGGLFDKFMLGNQLQYRLIKSTQLFKVLGPIPTYAPSWRNILEILLPLRDCIKRTENSSESSKTVEIRNLLIDLQKNLQKLRLSPPSLQTNLHDYLNSFFEWLFEIVKKLAEGNFPNKSFLTTQ